MAKVYVAIADCPCSCTIHSNHLEKEITDSRPCANMLNIGYPRVTLNFGILTGSPNDIRNSCPWAFLPVIMRLCLLWTRHAWLLRTAASSSDWLLKNPLNFSYQGLSLHSSHPQYACLNQHRQQYRLQWLQLPHSDHLPTALSWCCRQPSHGSTYWCWWLLRVPQDVHGRAIPQILQPWYWSWLFTGSMIRRSH